MVEMNLLPWREKRDKYQKTNLLRLMAMAVLLPLLLGVGVYLDMTNKIEKVHSHVTQQQDELAQFAEVQRGIERNNHKNAMAQDVIKIFVRHQMATRKLFDVLAQMPANPVCFTEIAREGQQVVFSGYTRSTVDLTSFLRAWQLSGVFSELHIDNIKKLTGHRSMRFKMRASQIIPSDEVARSINAV
jgi:Tfp pilus assembly protein PilN